jgi:hypothetical protein
LWVFAISRLLGLLNLVDELAVPLFDVLDHLFNARKDSWKCPRCKPSFEGWVAMRLPGRFLRRRRLRGRFASAGHW